MRRRADTRRAVLTNAEATARAPTRRTDPGLRCCRRRGASAVTDHAASGLSEPKLGSSSEGVLTTLSRHTKNSEYVYC